MQNKSKTFRFIAFALFLFIGLCFLYNIYALFFPIDIELESDAAEHLHAAYLLSIGEKPYLDFIQNHPMLFHHFLGWAENTFGLESTRSLATFGRVVVSGHFFLCLLVFFIWTSRLLKNRPKGIMWFCLLLTTWAMLDIYNPGFYWMWDLRPDFICYGQTLLGLFLIFLWIEARKNKNATGALVLGIVGGCLVGFGNAVIPKGIPFLGAFALTLVTVGLSNKLNPLSVWFKRDRFFSVLTVGIAVVLSFFAAMALDCHLSNVSIRSWISAVFLLNSRKHIIFSNIEDNPVSPLLETFSIPLPLVIAMIGWIVWELVNLQNQNGTRNNHLYIWLFAVFTILINLILPAYSTGVTWNYYFIPSVFSAALISLMFLLRLNAYLIKHSFKRSFTIPNGIAILLLAFIVIQIVKVPLHSIAQVGAKKAAARQVAEICPTDYIRNEVLPENFTYLGPPDQIPTKSRNWGYYFMLTRATNFWKDCYVLGLGPDPQKAWAKGFGENPPDAITLTSTESLSRFLFLAKECQQIDASWILEEIKKRYVLMTCRRASLYILKDKVSYMISMGWEIKPDQQSNLRNLFEVDR